jgi:sarcosine oxidase, subunit beta
MKTYSALSLARSGVFGSGAWQQAWRSAEPKAAYDAIIIGGGGHGLATAFHLARDHGLTNIAVLEKGWIGGGNTGRNTTVVRSDYYYSESAALFDFSLKCYEDLSKTLNFNTMVSQRSMLNLIHTRGGFDTWHKRANMMALNGIETEILDQQQTFDACPILNQDPNARFPILGAFRQKRAGTVRHDAVAWGYARGADALGVDIIQNCDVTNIVRDAMGRVTGVETSRGNIATPKIGLAAASHSNILAEKAGFRLPVQNLTLQAFVTEPIKPVLDIVVTSGATGVYASQSDKGGIVAGAGVDIGHSYAQRGNFTSMEWVTSGLIDLFPSFSRLKLLRQWGGTVDYTYDSSPIMGLSPVPGLYLNCCWGGGGFKAIPAGGVTFAYTIAKNEPHPLITGFGLDRFRTGRLIDEAAAAGIEH